MSTSENTIWNVMSRGKENTFILWGIVQNLINIRVKYEASNCFNFKCGGVISSISFETAVSMANAVTSEEPKILSKFHIHI